MSDKDFVDVGDELVVRIGGYPVGKVRVTDIIETFGGETKVVTSLTNDDGDIVYTFYLPLNVKEYEGIDGVTREPLQDNYDPTRYDNGYTYDRT